MAVVGEISRHKIDLDDANYQILIQYFHATSNALMNNFNEGRPSDQLISYDEIFEAKQLAKKSKFTPNIRFDELPPISEMDSVSVAQSFYDSQLRLIYPDGHPDFLDWNKLP